MSPRVILNRYRIEGRLGVGGMSTVHYAFDERLERQVAIKLLAEHLADDPAFVSRFRREALAAARLIHPNIVQVYDFGLDDATHRHFIVMELVDGQSCAEILRDRGRLDVDDAVDIVTQACRGLAYAHRHGVIHRDVKPGNLLRSGDGTVKLADFGIAKAAEQSQITQVGSVLGTAAYLAPEQARGEPAGPAADLYALGVVSYQLLAGRLPYEAASLTELAMRQQTEPPPRLDALRPDVPPALAAAIERALALDVAQRYSSAEEMETALHDGFRGIGATEAMTSVMGRSTTATRLLAPTRATEATRALPRYPVDGEPARRREPVPAWPRSERPPAARPTAAPARARSATRRLLTRLLILLVLIGAAVAATLVATNASNDPELRPVIQQKTRDTVQEFLTLINDNTR